MAVRSVQSESNLGPAPAGWDEFLDAVAVRLNATAGDRELHIAGGGHGLSVLRMIATQAAAPAEYRLFRDGGKVWIGLFTADRYLSQSIEQDLVHTGDKLPDLIIGNKKGTYVFLHEAKKVSAEEWAKAQPPVKFANFDDQQLKPGDVIQRTGAPR